MKISNIQEHSFLKFVTKYPSPNFDERPLKCVIDTIVIHYTDLFSLKESLEILTNAEMKVSSHYLIDENGDIYQLVDEKFRAWHAGVSHWKGRDNVNHFSIGIELQNPGMKYFEKYHTWKPYPEPLMKSLIDLIHDIKSRHPIKKENIIGHNHIAPDRKIDPGPHFDWNFLNKNLKF